MKESSHLVQCSAEQNRFYAGSGGSTNLIFNIIKYELNQTLTTLMFDVNKRTENKGYISGKKGTIFIPHLGIISVD